MVAHLAIQDSHRAVCYLLHRRYFDNREAETSVRRCAARRWVGFPTPDVWRFFVGFQLDKIGLYCTFKGLKIPKLGEEVSELRRNHAARLRR